MCISHIEQDYCDVLTVSQRDEPGVSNDCSNEIDPNHNFFHFTLRITNARFANDKNRILLFKHKYSFISTVPTEPPYERYWFRNDIRRKLHLLPISAGNENFGWMCVSVCAFHRRDGALSLRVRAKLMLKSVKKKRERLQCNIYSTPLMRSCIAYDRSTWLIEFSMDLATRKCIRKCSTPNLSLSAWVLVVCVCAWF